MKPDTSMKTAPRSHLLASVTDQIYYCTSQHVQLLLQDVEVTLVNGKNKLAHGQSNRHAAQSVFFEDLRDAGKHIGNGPARLLPALTTHLARTLANVQETCNREGVQEFNISIPPTSGRHESSNPTEAPLHVYLSGYDASQRSSTFNGIKHGETRYTSG